MDDQKKDKRPKPILCLDFDGVIHLYRSPWVDEKTISDPPTPGAIDFILRAQKHFRIAIYSSRSKVEEGRRAMAEFIRTSALRVHQASTVERMMSELEFPETKPPAFLTIDDRVFLFEGVWPDPEELLTFLPWNRKG